MPRNILNSLKKTTAILTSASLVYGCAITQSTGPNGVKAPGTNNKGFQIKNAPYCPFPSWEYPTAATSASGSGTSSVFHRLYGTFEGPIGGFSFGSLRVGTDPEGIVKIEALIQGNSGPNYYTTGAALTLNVDSLDHDFQFTKAMEVGYSSSNDTATTMFVGPGAVNVSYAASTGTWTVHVSGHGDLIPVGFLAFGTADFEATATYETGACNLPKLKVTADPPFISPANGDGKFDNGNIHVSSTSTQAWTLSIAGNKPGPAGQDGFPTKGDACSWSTSGTEPEKDIEWNGTCNDRTNMVDGEYEIKLESAGFEDTTSIKVDNTPPQFGAPLQTLLPGNDVRYSVDVRDPEVNQVASGLSSTKLNLEVLSNGQPVAISAPSLTAGAYAPGQGQHYQLEFTGPPLPGATLQILAEDNVANRNQNTVPACSPDKAPVMLPDDLNQLLDQLNNLNLADPNSVQQLQQLQNKLQNIQDQLSGLGFSTQSFHTLAGNNDKKIQNLLEKRTAVLAELANARDAMDEQMAPLDDQLLQLNSLAENEYGYSLLKYEGNLRPRSMARYKSTLDRIEKVFYYLTRVENNTYELLFAGFVTVLEAQIYRMLLDDYTYSTIPATSNQDEQTYAFVFNKIRDAAQPKELISVVARRLQRHHDLLIKKQKKKQNYLEKLLKPGLTDPASLVELPNDEPLDDFESDSRLGELIGFQTQAIQQNSFSIMSKPGLEEMHQELTPNTGGEGGGGGAAGGGGCCIAQPGKAFDSFVKSTAASILTALVVAKQFVKDAFDNRFKAQNNPIPNPCPNPSLFPTPSPTPSACEIDISPALASLLAQLQLDNQPGFKNPSQNGSITTTKWKAQGDINKVLQDLNNLIGDCEADNRDTSDKTLRTFTSPDKKTKINARSTSSDGRPTLDIKIYNSDGTTTVNKIRYE